MEPSTKKLRPSPAVMSANDDAGWWKDRMNGSEMCFLEFADGTLLPLHVETKLHVLCQEIPCLAFLLFGHPNMKPKEIKTRDGFPVLTMPKLSENEQPATKTFLELVDAVVRQIEGIELTPRLMTMVDQLGGCVRLDQLKGKQSVRRPPRSLEEDEHSEYYWFFFHCPPNDERSESEQNRLLAEGWELSRSPSLDEKVRTTWATFSFRKKKASRYDEEN